MKDSRLIFEGRKFQVRGVPIKLADNSVVERAIIVHPGAVVILAVTADKHIVFIRNKRFTVNERVLELPAGTLESNEAPERCALRELHEETGQRATSMKPLGWFYSAPGFCTEKLYAYLATDLTQCEQRLEPDEDIEVVLVPETEAHEMVGRGEIHDAKTLATLSLYFSSKG